MKLFNISKEWSVIVITWSFVFAAGPVYMYMLHSADGLEYSWARVFSAWGYTSAFFVLYLVHHFVLAPMFLNKKKHVLYFLCLASTVVLFSIFLYLYDQGHKPMPKRPPMEESILRGKEPEFLDAPKPHWYLVAPPNLARITILLLIYGMDIGLFAWFNQQKLRRNMLLLERQTLSRELEQLRFQINPHFFMNTLNNIHSLIDIDNEKAKTTIIELSRMMRYALYTNNSFMVELSNEVEFMKQYISLMRLRYDDDKIEIQTDFPENISKDVKLPPLLLITFVENAFKHGVSYMSYSFVHIHLWVEDEGRLIRFQCNNSVHLTNRKPSDSAHGIGLENVRKRLELQYGKNYELTITDTSNDLFGIDLTLDNNGLMEHNLKPDTL